MDTAIIQEEALRLPEGERALLADRLIESLSRTTPELEAAWLREADARIAAFREERIEAVDSFRAMADLRARFPR